MLEHGCHSQLYLVVYNIMYYIYCIYGYTVYSLVERVFQTLMDILSFKILLVFLQRMYYCWPQLLMHTALTAHIHTHKHTQREEHVAAKNC